MLAIIFGKTADKVIYYDLFAIKHKEYLPKYSCEDTHLEYAIIMTLQKTLKGRIVFDH